MKKTAKNPFDEYSVDVIPEGKENEYYTQEQSYEINKQMKSIAKAQIAFYACFILVALVWGIQRFVELAHWVQFLVYLISICGLCITIVIGTVKYLRFKKYLKEITNK